MTSGAEGSATKESQTKIMNELRLSREKQRLSREVEVQLKNSETNGYPIVRRNIT